MKFYALFCAICTLIILSTVVVIASITDADRAQIDAKLTGLSGLLINSYNYLQNNINNVVDYTKCSYISACPEIAGWDGASYFSVDLISSPFYGNDNVDPNNTVVKIMHETSPRASIMNEICFVESQKNIWTENLVQSHYGSDPNTAGVRWQYYGGESTVSIFNPGFKWAYNDVCPGSISTDYDPRNRPWYVSATSSQKNIIIIMDMSDTLPDTDGSRIFRMKRSVKLLLNGLSYRDFVGIVTYTEYSKTYISRLLRATVDNIKALDLYVDSLNITHGSKSNIGNAFQSAYAILNDSVNDGLTSNCNNIFFVVSSGTNDITTIKPIDVVKRNSNQNVIVFSNIYSSVSSVGSKLDLAETSCLTKGNMFTIKSESDALDAVNSFNMYMGTATYNQVVRWSEPYNDAVDDIRLITGSLPIYKPGKLRKVYGVTSIDIDILTLLKINTNLTELDIRNYLINKQTCPPLEITDVFLKEIQNPDTCRTPDSNQVSDPDTVKNREWIICLSGVIVLILIAAPFLLAIRGNSRFYGISSVLAFGMFVLGIWALCVLWIRLFPDIIRVNTWQATTLVTERMNDNSFRCCDIINCRSHEEYSGVSCLSMLSSFQEGACQSGYHCCQKNCYICDCYTSCTASVYTTLCHTYCSTCCYCAQSLNHRRCDSACGTCWDPVVIKSFRDKSGTLNYGYIVQQCNRDDRQCVDNFFATNGPVGKSTPGYYNPYNNNEIATNISYKPKVLAAFLIPVSMMLLILVVVLVLFIIQRWNDDTYSRRVSNYYV